MVECWVNLICLQEPKNEFGPRVREKVRELQTLFGNVYVVSSSSRKMTVPLMKQWVNNSMVPQMQEIAVRSPPPARSEPSDQPQPGCSWYVDNSTDSTQIRSTCPAQPTALVVADSWGGNTNQQVQNLMEFGGITFIRIPEGTTNELQPCDIEVFRHWKYVARRLTMQAHYDGFIGALTSRAGIINMHSLIHNQFSAPAYEDLFRYSWRHADKTFSKNELSNDVVMRASHVQFSFKPGAKCEVDDCDEPAFIKCSHRSRLLCATHFFERKCFHEVNESDCDEIDFDDDLFDADLLK